MLLIAASVLAARKLAQFDGGKKVPATVAAISDAIRWAEEIMKGIDERWPTREIETLGKYLDATQESRAEQSIIPAVLLGAFGK